MPWLYMSGYGPTMALSLGRYLAVLSKYRNTEFAMFLQATCGTCWCIGNTPRHRLCLAPTKYAGACCIQYVATNYSSLHSQWGFRSSAQCGHNSGLHLFQCSPRFQWCWTSLQCCFIPSLKNSLYVFFVHFCIVQFFSHCVGMACPVTVFAGFSIQCSWPIVTVLKLGIIKFVSIFYLKCFPTPRS